MNKKHLTIFISIFLVTLIILFGGYYFNKTDSSSSAVNIKTSTVDGVYILSTPKKISYLSKDSSKPLETDILGGWEICSVGDGKAYVPIRGNPDTTGQEVAVFKDGKLQKNIALEYNMPTFIKYNQYNKKAYIGHACKITNHEENCITVIDTQNDTEEQSIMYDRFVGDITFSKDYMFVSSCAVTGGDDRLEVFDLKDNSIVKSITLDVRLTSIEYIEGNNFVYGVNENESTERLYVLDWENESLSYEALNIQFPYKLSVSSHSGNELIYINHFSIDDNKGRGISVIDPSKGKIVKEISSNYSSPDIEVFDSGMLICDWNDNKLIVTDLDGNAVTSIDVTRPISVCKL